MSGPTSNPMAPAPQAVVARIAAFSLIRLDEDAKAGTATVSIVPKDESEQPVTLFSGRAADARLYLARQAVRFNLATNLPKPAPLDWPPTPETPWRRPQFPR